MDPKPIIYYIYFFRESMVDNPILLFPPADHAGRFARNVFFRKGHHGMARGMRKGRVDMPKTPTPLPCAQIPDTDFETSDSPMMITLPSLSWPIVHVKLYLSSRL